MAKIDKDIKTDTEYILQKLETLKWKLVDYRKSAIYKAEVRKISHRIEKSLLLVKEAKQIIGE